MPSRTRQLDAEIRGDWNNLKGTEYHLVYALWLLLCDGAHRVELYQGNDLLAHRPHAPASGDQESGVFPIVSVHAANADSDVWIQLKATNSSWTPSTFLEENLLKNFIHNALLSKKRGRNWETKLVTQGEVRKKQLRDFVSLPEKSPKLKKLKLILDDSRFARIFSRF